MGKPPRRKTMQHPQELPGIQYWLLAITLVQLFTVIALLIGIQTNAIYIKPLLLFLLVFLTFTVALAAVFALKTKLQEVNIVLVIRRKSGL